MRLGGTPMELVGGCIQARQLILNLADQVNARHPQKHMSEEAAGLGLCSGAELLQRKGNKSETSSAKQRVCPSVSSG